MEITKDIIIKGVGGHAAEGSLIFQDQIGAGEKIRIAGFLDDNPELHGKHVFGIPVFGGMRRGERADASSFRVICAIVSPLLCRKVVHHSSG